MSIVKKKIFSIAVALAFIIIAVVSVIILNITIVYVYVESELKMTHLVLGEEDLKLHFNSSITGMPVTIHFKIGQGKIRGHALEADEAMIEYYSMGILDVSTTIKGYESRNIEFCSTQNFKIVKDNREVKLENACIKIEAHNVWSFIFRGK